MSDFVLCSSFALFLFRVCLPACVVGMWKLRCVFLHLFFCAVDLMCVCAPQGLLLVELPDWLGRGHSENKIGGSHPIRQSATNTGNEKRLQNKENEILTPACR
jgi:hypothetical protein